MRTANPYRGEISLELAGQRHVLRPSFEALVAIEQERGSLLAMIERASAGTLMLDDIVTVLWACMRAGGSDYDKAMVGRRVVETGIAAATPAFRDLLTMALTGQAIHHDHAQPPG